MRCEECNHRGQGNIIRVRVHQPGKQKDICVDKAHLLNMFVLTIDIKSSIYRECIQEVKKKKNRERDYTDARTRARYMCVYVCGCKCVQMREHVYTACVYRVSIKTRSKKEKREKFSDGRRLDKKKER